MENPSRNSVLARETGSERQNKDSSSPMAAEKPLVPVLEQCPSSPTQQTNPEGPSVEGPRREHHARPQTRSLPPPDPPLHGRFDGGLGGPPEGPQNIRDMGQSGEEIPYQPTGDDIRPESPSPLFSLHCGPEDRLNVGQQYGSSLLEQTGGTRSKTLCDTARKVLQLSESHFIDLRAKYIPGKRNVLADALSRKNQVIGTE